MTRWRSDREVAEWAQQCVQFDSEHGVDPMADRVLRRVLGGWPDETSQHADRPVAVAVVADGRSVPESRRPGVLAAAAAAAVLVVIASVVVWRAAAEREVPVGQGQAAPEWQLVGDSDGTLSPEDGDGRLTLSGVTARADGFVAVGTELRDGDETPVVVESPDGRAWSRIDNDLLPGGGAGRALLDAAGRLDRVLVAGARQDTGASVPIVWSSPDLRGWDELALPGAVGAKVSAIAVDGEAAVIVGQVDGRGGDSAVAWVSSGGAPWRLVQLPDAGGTSVAIDVAATQHGFVAVGEVDDRAAAWLLADDGAWTLTPSLGGPGTALTSVAARGTAVVTTGRSTTAGVDDVLVRWSADAVHWRTSELPPAEVPRFPGPLVAGADGFVLLGTALVGRELANVELRSEDGRMWAPRQVDLPGNRLAAASGSSALVAVGSAGSSPAAPGTDPAARASSIWLAQLDVRDRS